MKDHSPHNHCTPIKGLAYDPNYEKLEKLRRQCKITPHIN